MMIRPLLALALLFAATPVLAWGDYAHRLIASTAMAELRPRARAEVRRILARGTAVDTPTCALRTVEDASVWPDCARSLGDRFAFSAAWHYQNIDVCQPFDITANCPNGDCVTAQIPRQLAIAADRRASPAARAQALAFVVHFVGDMHQPLHIGDKHDRGGNDVRASYGAKAPDRMNLHRIWDSDLAERALTEPPAITPWSPTTAQRRDFARGTITDWARESWDVSRTIAYPELRDFPDTCPAKSSIRAMVDEAYVTTARASIRLQVERAGVRLAMLLNGAFGR
ncbi:MAG: S1/P1 nuclease [Polymorphobacter sp.]